MRRYSVLLSLVVLVFAALIATAPAAAAAPPLPTTSGQDTLAGISWTASLEGR